MDKCLTASQVLDKIEDFRKEKPFIPYENWEGGEPFTSLDIEGHGALGSARRLKYSPEKNAILISNKFFPEDSFIEIEDFITFLANHLDADVILEYHSGDMEYLNVIDVERDYLPPFEGDEDNYAEDGYDIIKLVAE